MNKSYPYIVGIMILSIFVELEVDVGIVIRPFDVMLAFFLGYKIVLASQKSQKNKRVMTVFVDTTALTYIPFAAYYMLNSLRSVNWLTVMVESLQIFEFIILLYLVAQISFYEQYRKMLLTILYKGSGFLAVLGAAIHIAMGKFTNYKDLGEQRLIFSLFALLSVYFLWSNSEKKNENLAAVILAWGLMVLSGERKGWIAAVVGVFILIFGKYLGFAPPKRIFINFRQFLTTLLLIGIGIGAMIFIYSVPEMEYIARQFDSFIELFNALTGGGTEDLEDSESASNRSRAMMMEEGLRLFSEYPIEGIGVDQFRVYMEKRFSTASFQTTHDAHNYYLKILVESGLIGALLFLVFIVTNIIESFNLNRRAKGSIETSLVMALMIYGIIMNAFMAARATVFIFYFVPCGLMIGIFRQLKYEQLSKTKRWLLYKKNTFF